MVKSDQKRNLLIFIHPTIVGDGSQEFAVFRSSVIVNFIAFSWRWIPMVALLNCLKMLAMFIQQRLPVSQSCHRKQVLIKPYRQQWSETAYGEPRL